jgi:hypothetical protein
MNEKKTTWAIVGTCKDNKIRKTLAGGFCSRESAERQLDKYTSDKYMKSIYRYMKVAKEDYKPRMEGD